MKDAHTKGGTLESGTTEKTPFKKDTPNKHGMAATGPSQHPEGGFDRPRMTGNKPQANPSHKCKDGKHSIK